MTPVHMHGAFTEPAAVAPQVEVDHSRFLNPSARGARALLSVVVPTFDEREALPQLHERLVAALDSTETPWEILYVDDGSSDGSHALLKAFHACEPRVGVIRLARNFGKEAAMAAGLQMARGDAVVIIDADLQDPPELIGRMVDAWRAGADVVNMRRTRRLGESLLKRSTAHGFYRVLNRLADVEVPHDVGDFRLLSRRVVDALNALPERNRFMKGLFAWVGYRQAVIEYNRDARASGTSKWRYWKLWNFALEGITGFSTAPLKLATYTGVSVAVGAFVFAGYIVAKTLLLGDPVPGFTTLVTTVLLVGGVQLMAVGVLGEYVGRLLIESKRRPLYLVDEWYPAASSCPRPDVPASHAVAMPLSQ